MGDPLRQNIKSSAVFFDELRFNNKVLPQFQLKQGVTQNGEPLQLAYPSDEIRFLNEEEISSLQDTTDRYRSFRFLNLRELSFPRLLARQEFPYDNRHRARENRAGDPPFKDDLYYDARKNQFVKIAPEISAAETSPVSQEVVEEDSELPLNGTPEPAQKEKIIEFLYDLFQDDAPHNNEEESTPLVP
ncbi:MAG: hypothetical protein F3745_02120 [Nitrospinae bacterium]|nr:hypothetical protein [Nitrospinota bacterium]